MMFLASVLIIPIGIAYATYDDSPTFTTPAPTTTPSNETNTNMTMPTTNETNTTPKPSTPLDPLKQFESGVSSKDIQCPADFSLVLKASDGSPACVHSSTVQILIQRGWAAIQ